MGKIESSGRTSLSAQKSNEKQILETTKVQRAYIIIRHLPKYRMVTDRLICCDL
jgi:hypothetical protein